MRQIVVEFLYQPPLTEAAMSTAFERLQPFFAAGGVHRLRSWVADDRSRGFCELEASDLQTVAEAYQRAKVPFVRIWSGKIYEFDLPGRAGVPDSYEELAGP